MLKRFSAIGYTAALATAPAWATACSTPPAAEAQDPSVLFSLTSESMRFENPAGANVTLVMEGVDPHTVWFTDRPARESGAIATGQLAAEWAEGETFDVTPPNAAVVLHESVSIDGETTDTLVAEVQSMSYDPASETLRADLQVLLDEEASTVEGNLSSHGDNHDYAWPAQAGAVSLFIDSVTLDAVTSPASAAPKASGIVLCSSPATCNKDGNTNYTYNSTIYFQATITSDVT